MTEEFGALFLPALGQKESKITSEDFERPARPLLSFEQIR